MGQESKLEKKMREYAESKGFLFWKFVSPGTRGVPDRVLIGDEGVLVFVEMKKPGEKPRPEQERRIDDLRTRGHDVVVIDNWDTAKGIIDYFLYTRNKPLYNTI